MTSSCNFVVLLGAISPVGVTFGFTPQLGGLATFTLWLHQAQTAWGAPRCVAIPCAFTGVLTRLCEGLLPGALVIVRGAIDMHDEELGDDTGRLVVVGTALTVVQAGEDQETRQEPVSTEVLERGLARFAADGRRGGKR